MASRAVAVTAMFASLVVIVLGADKPTPSFELKDRPNSWDSTWRNCDDDRRRGDSGGRVGGAPNDAVTVVDVVPSPGSFAGRTGHSGSMKFVVDMNEKVLSEGRISRQVSYEGHSGAEEKLDLCEWTEECPLGPGRTSFASRRHKVPWYSPGGSYNYTYRLFDRHGELLFCTQVDIRMSCANGTKVCPGLPLA
mmetsp:Transcript_7542/g.19183  ORF Transcript_7542/g.19183 Transcript_7542/m.19183 type:complete len:193 (-) Transcript_7542:305-883(-)